MFDLDTWQEIVQTMRRNKLRTTLTAAGVFWGMFMLMVMLGFGDALERGTKRGMGGFATNAVYIWGQRTSLPYKGFQPGRSIDYNNADAAAVKREVDGIEYFAPRNQLGGYQDGNNVGRGAKTGNFQVMGDMPDMRFIQPMEMVHGRFLNDLDVQRHRKVAVIGNTVYEVLFQNGEDPVGQQITINGVSFMVIGSFKSAMPGDRGERQAGTIHIPFSTFQRAFNYGDRVGWFAITGDADASATQVEAHVRAVLRNRHSIHPDDSQGIGSYNSEKDFEKMSNLFWGIRLFVWFVGTATLATGLVGVSNIMLIVVRERTKEIGLRRALGATPFSVVSLVLLEATVLTGIAGYSGLIGGLALLQIVSVVIGPDNPSMGQPRVDLVVAFGAGFILLLGGFFSGLLPAQRAVNIKTVDALRAD
ncbi:MAG: FtsX-like permease family protein [Rhodobacterales bacterium]|nr:FtsX-like permease family protein [Rhodobacterales bacterium]